MTSKPDLKWIKLSQLYIPQEYQRTAKGQTSLANINYIKKNFNWVSCGALVVCELEKSKPPQYAVIDGQHRFKAAEAIGIAELPCLVASPEEVKKQAHHFIEINTKRNRLHPLHEFQAAVVAGQDRAVQLAALLKRAEISLPSTPLSSKDAPPRVTQAIGTLYSLLPNYTDKQIIWGLTIIPEAYGKRHGVMRACLIKAMCEWIKIHPDTDRETMKIVLAETDLDQLEKDARSYRAIDKISMPAAFMLVFEQKYKQEKKRRAA